MRNTHHVNRIKLIFDDFMSALAGVMYNVMESGQSINLTGVQHFEKRSFQLLQNASKQCISALSDSAYSIDTEARSKAHTDAHLQAPDAQSDDIDVNAVATQIFSYMTLAIAQLSQILRRMIIRHRLLINSGMNYNSARIKVKEQFRNEILKLTSIDRIGRRRDISLSVVMTTAIYFNQLEQDTYLATANQLGYSEFEIYQPSHDRHGKRFTADNIPKNDLHPQSDAVIKLVERSNVHTA